MPPRKLERPPGNGERPPHNSGRPLRGADRPLGADTDRPPRADAGRPLRADAQRNRDRVLAAAKEVFAEHGPEAPLDDIARRAGVGNATMYRHFATRQELIIAVYADEVAELTAHGRTLLNEESPAEALFTWLRAFIAHVATKRHLALALTSDHSSALFDRWHEAMHSTASALLAKAQHTNAVRSDLDVPDLLALANGIALAGADTAQTERLLTLIRTGTG